MNALSVNAEKIEAIWLGVGARERPPLAERAVSVRGVSVEIARHTRYIGVEVDERGTFLHHFRLLAPKLERTVAALGRLLPNLRRPGDGARENPLYAGVVRSMALYRAPEWAERPCGNRRIKEQLDSV